MVPEWMELLDFARFLLYYQANSGAARTVVVPDHGI